MKKLSWICMIACLLAFSTGVFAQNDPVVRSFQKVLANQGEMALHQLNVPQERSTEWAGTLLEPSQATSETLFAALHHQLKPLATTFLAAEKETGVNAYFLCAVAALESGWGRSRVAQEKNNLFGWTGKGGYQTFSSTEECILEVARRIKKLYLSPEGPYFHGYTVQDVNVCYNGSDAWQREVENLMEQIERRATAV